IARHLPELRSLDQKLRRDRSTTLPLFLAASRHVHDRDLLPRETHTHGLTTEPLVEAVNDARAIRLRGSERGMPEPASSCEFRAAVRARRSVHLRIDVSAVVRGN